MRRKCDLFAEGAEGFGASSVCPCGGIFDISFMCLTFHPPRVPVAVSLPCDHRVPGTFVAL